MRGWGADVGASVLRTDRPRGDGAQPSGPDRDRDGTDLQPPAGGPGRDLCSVGLAPSGRRLHRHELLGFRRHGRGRRARSRSGPRLACPRLVAIVTVAVFWWLMADVLLLRMPCGMLPLGKEQ